MQSHRLGASVSRSAKRKLKSLCTLQHSWEKLRIGTKTIRLWSNNSACTPQRLFSNLALFARISHFAMNIIMAQALPNRQSKFRQMQKFQQSAKINSRQNFRPYGIYNTRRYGCTPMLTFLLDVLNEVLGIRNLYCTSFYSARSGLCVRPRDFENRLPNVV